LEERLETVNELKPQTAGGLNVTLPTIALSSALEVAVGVLKTRYSLAPYNLTNVLNNGIHTLHQLKRLTGLERVDRHV
jgi:hypothetical protein